MTGPGFHVGELAVQERAGVRESAARLARLLDPADLDGGLRRFLALQRFAALTALGVDGLLWNSPLVGPAGFLAGHGSELTVAALPRAGDPLVSLAAGAEIGLVDIDLPARRCSGQRHGQLA
ncbi:hypothetical protein [uncultured Jatrophihabitans sp.]|uniref:hypothetical protein n=1 Tax=uncultured Jatrophihabitans sp. TaxID=1610747 RepID=UPI0035C9C3D7